MKHRWILIIITLITAFNGIQAQNKKDNSLGELTLIVSTNLSNFQLQSTIKPDYLLSKISKNTSTGELQISHQLELPLEAFQANNKLIKQDFCELLKVRTNPFIFIAMNQAFVSDMRKTKDITPLQVELTIGGVKNMYLVSTKVDATSKVFYTLNGHQSIKLSDFGIKSPTKFFGLISVNDTVNVNFTFDICHPLYYSHEIQY